MYHVIKPKPPSSRKTALILSRERGSFIFTEISIRGRMSITCQGNESMLHTFCACCLDQVPLGKFYVPASNLVHVLDWTRHDTSSLFVS